MNRANRTGRNDPCPCGSGRKFKHCCGNPNDPARTETGKGEVRRCGDCSLCCEGWVKTRVLGHTIGRGLAVDILVSAGHDPDEKLLSWFKERSVRERRPFIFQQNENWFGFEPLWS